MKRIIGIVFATFACALLVAPCAWAAPATQTGAQQQASPALTSTKAPAVSTAKAATVVEAPYIITTALRGSAALDVSGASNSDGAKVQIYTANTTPAQRWRVERIGKTTYYRIVNVGSGKVLDVAGGVKKSGTSVQQYTWNNTAAQKWKFVKVSGGYAIVSALSNTLVLNVAGSKNNNGTRVQVATSNGSKAQVWKLSRQAATIANGFYTIANKGSNKVLDIAAASIEAGGNLQQYAKNGTIAQTFQALYDKKTGYYTLRNAGSGKVMDVANASKSDGANVQQFTNNNTFAQKWTIRKNSNGTYTLYNAASGKVLDVSGGSKNNGANVQQWESNNTTAQMWKFAKVTNWVPSGTYYIICGKAHGNALAVANASVANRANIQTAAKADSNAQRFFIRSKGNGYYTIQNTYSGKYVDAYLATKSANVSQTGIQEQWRPVLTNNGIVFQLKSNPKIVLDVAGGKTSPGANVQVYPSNNTAAQKWLLRPTTLLANGTYTVASSVNTKFVFDIAGGSKASGVALQVYQANKTASQNFKLTYVKNGTYTLVSQVSNKGLQLDNLRVSQQNASTKAAQRWKPVLNTNGTISFISASDTSKKLTLNGTAKNETKVSATKSNGKNTQNWIVRSVAGSSTARGKTTYDNLSITMAQLAAIEGSSVYNVNPANGNKYRFLDLRVYTGCTADDLDRALQKIAPWIGPGNPLYKSGKYFVEAAKKYNVNEVFLLAQAGGETGWGESYGGPGGYNFYGVDGGAGTAGALYNEAAKRGWTTIEKGIVEGAKYIADEWVYRPNYPQRSVYGLRFDYFYVDETRQYSYHHYTTSDAWVNTVSGTIEKLYKETGKASSASFVYPKFRS